MTTWKSLPGIFPSGTPSPERLRILITNAFVDRYTGTEVVVRDLALELQRQGHEPVIYSPRLGVVAKEVRAAGIHCTDDLRSIPSPPDIIHGQHHAPVIEALLRFSRTPAIYVCHDASSPLDEPPCFPRILRYVAVDLRCRRRLENLAAISRDRISVIENAVDLTRFRPRLVLPAKPRKALVFSNSRRQYSVVRQASLRQGLTLDALGAGFKTDVHNPEVILPDYDLIFAKARCALEALCVGCAVVLCDFPGAGPLVTTANLEALRRMNFGRGTLTNPLESSWLASEIARYDPADAAEVSRRLRAEAGLPQAAVRWLNLYSDVIAEFCQRAPDPATEKRALESYLQWSETDHAQRHAGEWRKSRQSLFSENHSPL